MENFYLDSHGSGRIFCRIWAPDTPPKAVLQIVHGIAEHTERYDEFARFLTARGFLVAAEDHMGHGYSIGTDGIKGYFSGGWEAAAADSLALQARLHEAYPALPHFLLGHSMGSFLARTMLFRAPQSGLRAAILSGTGWQPEAALTFGLALCRMEARKRGDTAVSPLLNSLIFGSYNKKFRPNRTPYDWICTDPKVVDRYAADPLCGFDATIGLTRDLLTGIRTVQRPENLAKMDKTLPVWFFSGKSDPVGAMGKGVTRAVEAFRRAGMQQVSCTLYDGRHEMLNEVNRQQVYLDTAAFLEQYI